MRMLAVAVMLAALAWPGAAAKGPVEVIRYESGACFGRCPVDAITLSSDGRGVFEGQRDTAVQGRRAFIASRAQVAAFRARLRPVRPHGEVLVTPGQPLCKSAATDQVTVDVRWTGGAGDPRHLAFYFGCDMSAHRDVRAALVAAPRALPIAALIGGDL